MDGARVTVSPRLPADLVAELRRLARKTGLKQEVLIAACIREGMPAVERRYDQFLGGQQAGA